MATTRAATATAGSVPEVAAPAPAVRSRGRGRGGGGRGVSASAAASPTLDPAASQLAASGAEMRLRGWYDLAKISSLDCCDVLGCSDGRSLEAGPIAMSGKSHGGESIPAESRRLFLEPQARRTLGKILGLTMSLGLMAVWGYNSGKTGYSDGLWDVQQMIALNPSPTQGSEAGGNITRNAEDGGNSSHCPTSFELGGSSEITMRDFKCPALPDCGIYDLKNVAVQDNTLHVYAPGADTVDVLRRWDNRLPALSYTWGGVPESGSPVVVHKEPLDETMCPSRTTGISFYSVPHFQENNFHLHNDNFIPMSSNLLSTPCLCRGVELSSCNQYKKTNVRTRPLKQTHGHTHPDLLDLLKTLFDNTVDLPYSAQGSNLAPAEANGKMHCLDHMVWGFVKPFYIDCQLNRSSATWAWAHHTRQYLGVQSAAPPPEVALVPPAPPSGTQPRVIFLHRTPIVSGRDRTNRFMRDVEPLRQAWASEGIDMDDWYYEDSASLKNLIGPLSEYDIFLGVHGAQLTNVLYGKEGLVLVEVTNAVWDKDLFHKVAQARRGGYVKVRTLPETHFQVDHDAAVQVVRCALSLWRRDDTRHSMCSSLPGVAQSRGLNNFYEVGHS